MFVHNRKYFELTNINNMMIIDYDDDDDDVQGGRGGWHNVHSSRFTSRLRHLEEGGGKADQLGKVMQLMFLHLESQIQGGKVMQ